MVEEATDGKFGGELTAIQRPATSSDLLRDWSELSTASQVATALLALLLWLVAVGVLGRIIYGVGRLLYRIIIPRRLRPPETQVLPPVQ